MDTFVFCFTMAAFGISGSLSSATPQIIPTGQEFLANVGHTLYIAMQLNLSSPLTGTTDIYIDVFKKVNGIFRDVVIDAKASAVGPSEEIFFRHGLNVYPRVGMNSVKVVFSISNCLESDSAPYLFSFVAIEEGLILESKEGINMIKIMPSQLTEHPDDVSESTTVTAPLTFTTARTANLNDANAIHASDAIPTDYSIGTATTCSPYLLLLSVVMSLVYTSWPAWTLKCHHMEGEKADRQQRHQHYPESAAVFQTRSNIYNTKERKSKHLP
ncbi:uncharacterized protein [Ptychodera flava]|uniref:uncharacterized protein isoform X2 n=1 Tax=Ptychodera flava TaxID=63121 RepID=UPI00396A0E39